MLNGSCTVQDRDTLADLQSCLYHYEHVAESDDDPKRAEEIRTNKEKLARIIDKIQEEVKGSFHDTLSLTLLICMST